MAQNRFVWDGLAELREELRRLPDELKGEAGNIAQGTANAAAVAVRTAYGKHRRSGNLQDHVVVDIEEASGPYGVSVMVKNTSRLAYIFEIGTKARHYFTKKRGVKHLTGAMPEGNVFIPRMIIARRRMYEELKAMLVRHGLQVSGDG